MESKCIESVQPGEKFQLQAIYLRDLMDGQVEVAVFPGPHGTLCTTILLPNDVEVSTFE